MIRMARYRKEKTVEEIEAELKEQVEKEQPNRTSRIMQQAEDVLKVDADDDGVGGDDAADCLRYAVATKIRTVSQCKLRGF